MKPLILISNDDGIDSATLHALADAIDTEARADLLIVAPERQRSAASHAITLHKPLRIREHAPGRFSLSGTPVDCVYVGIHTLTTRRPALVLSGINLGFNLGSDVFYSGTVAAAREGGLRGIRSIALSMEPSPDRDVAAGVRFCLALVNEVLFGSDPSMRALFGPDHAASTILNVNLPGTTSTVFTWTKLGNRAYKDDVQQRLDPRGRPYYWIGGGSIADVVNEPGTDCHALAQGVASITPLSLRATDQSQLKTCTNIDIEGFRRIDPSANPATWKGPQT